jgi:NAD(P)H-dependent nitrite reductase large subunit/NAD(P)H-dependent nitrite reductase small subunit
MSLWVPVCRLDDIVPNTGVCALVGRRQVAVFRLDDDSFHAIDNHDPFSRANVLSRGIVGDLRGELVVASPVYKQHFSLRTGECLEDPGVRVAVHAVRVEGGTVWVRRVGEVETRQQRLVVVGNGMAGVRVLEELLAAAPRRYDITVFGAEPHGNYNRILLSPVLAGEKSLADIVTHPHDWYAQNGITLHAGDPVMRIDRRRREVIAQSGRTVAYDRLLLATGSKPFLLPVPGRELPGVIAFRDIADVEAMLDASRRHRRALVIGGGLLGLEAAYGLHRRGMEVSVVHLVDRLMERQLDAAAAALLQRHLEDNGIDILLNARTEAVLGEDRVTGVRLKDGRELAADLVVLAAGIVPNVGLAKGSGLACDHGVLVNDTLQSFDPRIYAVGECAQHRNITYGLVAPLWEQARVCANHLAGHGAQSYRGSVVAARLKVTGVELFSAGNFLGGEGTRDMLFKDVRRGVYKRLVLRGDRLEGVVLYGDAADSGWYLELIQSRAEVSRFGEQLIFGKRYAGLPTAA